MSVGIRHPTRLQSALMSRKVTVKWRSQVGSIEVSPPPDKYLLNFSAERWKNSPGIMSKFHCICQLHRSKKNMPLCLSVYYFGVQEGKSHFQTSSSFCNDDDKVEIFVIDKRNVNIKSFEPG